MKTRADLQDWMRSGCPVADAAPPHDTAVVVGFGEPGGLVQVRLFAYCKRCGVEKGAEIPGVMEDRFPDVMHRLGAVILGFHENTEAIPAVMEDHILDGEALTSDSFDGISARVAISHILANGYAPRPDGDSYSPESKPYGRTVTPGGLALDVHFTSAASAWGWQLRDLIREAKV
ncbi:hypothetical protein LCGC14_1524030 [marine sediment metagenome]|uniref:Uncharacterized protein n=1 Tax=marine sediment metagenome TaxID=412755 RepID=A0A0F9JIM5_9ZZZZ